MRNNIVVRVRRASFGGLEQRSAQMLKYFQDLLTTTTTADGGSQRPNPRRDTSTSFGLRQQVEAQKREQEDLISRTIEEILPDPLNNPGQYRDSRVKIADTVARLLSLKDHTSLQSLLWLEKSKEERERPNSDIAFHMKQNRESFNCEIPCILSRMIQKDARVKSCIQAGLQKFVERCVEMELKTCISIPIIQGRNMLCGVPANFKIPEILIQEWGDIRPLGCNHDIVSSLQHTAARGAVVSLYQDSQGLRSRKNGEFSLSIQTGLARTLPESDSNSPTVNKIIKQACEYASQDLRQPHDCCVVFPHRVL
jgi:hypothetical protein